MTAPARLLVVLLCVLLGGCVSRPAPTVLGQACGWRGYTHTELATAEAGVRYMDYRGDVVCVGDEN